MGFKLFFLTPCRKHLGKAVAHGSKKAVAVDSSVECMKDSTTRTALM